MDFILEMISQRGPACLANRWRRRVDLPRQRRYQIATKHCNKTDSKRRNLHTARRERIDKSMPYGQSRLELSEYII